MTISLQRIDYSSLNARQKENFNFQKLSAILADFGFVTMRLTDDWGGADFIAQHIDGETFLRVQLKGRLTFDTKYQNKGLFIAFPYANDWYLFPHDELLATVLSETKTISGTRSWDEKGNYHMGTLSTQLLKLLEPFRLTTDGRNKL